MLQALNRISDRAASIGPGWRVTRKVESISIAAAVVVCLVSFLVTLPVAAQVQRVALRVGEAQVLEVRGDVQRIRSLQGVSSNSPIPAGAVVTVGDRLKSGPDGYALLGLVDGSSIELRPATELEILDFSGGVRQLFKIWLGKVRIKIRKLIGAPNPYQMHSPIATIGVRGTEFEIAVQQNEVTTVRVFEGLVSVKNTQIEKSEVLVGPGREVTIYPLRPPDPPVTFEQVVAENFSRESAVEQPLLEKFQAFPDPQLDLVENPAYASMIYRPSGRFYLFPAYSQAFSSPEISLMSPVGRFVDLKELFATDERRLQGVSSRVSYVYPFDRWVLGGVYEFRGTGQDFDFRISRQIPSAFGGDVTIQQVGSSQFAPNLNSDNRSNRAIFVAARRFTGRTLAFSYDWVHSGGDLSTLYEFKPGGMLLSNEESHAVFSTDQKRLTVGYSIENDNIGSVGLLYRLGAINSSTNQDYHLLNGELGTLAGFQSSGYSHEIGARWRKRLLPNLYFSLKGDLTRTDLNEGIRRFRIADSNRSIRYWIPSIASGLGFDWRERLFLSFDYKYSNVREHSLRWDLFDNQLVNDESLSRHNHGIHLWGQYHLPRGFFVGGGMNSFWASEALAGTYNIDSSGSRLDVQGQEREPFMLERARVHVDQLGFSFGKRFRDRLFLEYQISQTRGPSFGPFGHSLLFRFSF